MRTCCSLPTCLLFQMATCSFCTVTAGSVSIHAPLLQVAEKTKSACEGTTVNFDASSAECAHSNACSDNYHAISSQAEGCDTAADNDGW